MNEILKQALLYDFYGELLNEHQKEIYEQFVLEDLSLSEIAQGAGISRQGVHDLVKRCQLHLVERFLRIKEEVQNLDQVLDRQKDSAKPENEMIREIREIADRIIEEL